MKRVRLYRGVVVCLLAGLITATFTAPAPAETIARCGQGWLERIDGYLVVHLKGTPYEMGYQHGALLKSHVRQNMNYLVHEQGDKTLVKFGGFNLKSPYIFA